MIPGINMGPEAYAMQQQQMAMMQQQQAMQQQGMMQQQMQQNMKKYQEVNGKLEAATEDAKKENPALDGAIFDDIKDTFQQEYAAKKYIMNNVLVEKVHKQFIDKYRARAAQNLEEDKGRNLKAEAEQAWEIMQKKAAPSGGLTIGTGAGGVLGFLAGFFLTGGMGGGLTSIIAGLVGALAGGFLGNKAQPFIERQFTSGATPAGRTAPTSTTPEKEQDQSIPSPGNDVLGALTPSPLPTRGSGPSIA